jgi:hypothetical protein
MGQNLLQRMVGAIPRTPGGIARTALSAATGIPAPMIKSAQGALNPARIPAAAVTRGAPFLGKGLIGGGLLFGALEGLAPARTGKGTLAENDPERYRSIVSMQNGGTLYSGDPDAGPGKVSEMNDPSQADYVAPKDRAYVEEVSRLAQQAQTDPYFQQMQQYEAARKQAVGSGNQAQMDAVRDLGLAINAAKFGTPEQRMQQTVGRFNPQMAGMPGYPATREAFEQQRPFIAPEEEARIGAMDMASQALQGAMQGQAGTQFPTQALGVMQRPAGVSPNTSVFAGPQAGQAGMSMSPTTDISAIPEEAKAEFLKRLQSFRPM